MKQFTLVSAPIALVLLLLLLIRAEGTDPMYDRLWRHRNLGKAFYENPTTQLEAVVEFKKALDLAPASVRERINYGLALLRAGKVKEGMAQLKQAQELDPKIPHTWFNLGIAFKKESQYGQSIEQFEGMLRLVPEEPVSHYNLGVLYKLTGKHEIAQEQFETACRLAPNLAGPHFQLYNAYLRAGRADDAERELGIFTSLKKGQAGAAVPEDLEWSSYSEIYDTVPVENPTEVDSQTTTLRFEAQKVGRDLDPASAGLAVTDIDGDGLSDLIAWSSHGIQLFKNGSIAVIGSGLDDLRDVVSISAGDFNNDGLADLAVLTQSGASLYVNKKGTFQRYSEKLPLGNFTKAVWLDYDHDNDLDLFLLGERPALARNNGQAGFSDETASFPFLPGRAVDGLLFDRLPDTNRMDLVVAYSDRAGALYRDELGGRYEVQLLSALPAGAESIAAYDFNNDGWTDLAVTFGNGVLLLMNREGRLDKTAGPDGAKGPLVFSDLANRANGDLVIGDSIYRKQDPAQWKPTKAEGLPPSVAIVEADFDNDGRLDLEVVTQDGTVDLLHNQTATSCGWLGVGLLGTRNLKLASAAKVEVKAGVSYQKKIYRGVPLVFGLRSYQEAETVRITWPNGLIQNELKQSSSKKAIYKEAARLSGSCPMVFAWNGRKFEFITDVLGVAPLGASAGDHKTFPTDHDEYIQIPGESLALKEGYYEIRITEELHEVSYLDQIRLISLDHSTDVDLFTNDKFNAPPFPEFRLFGTKRRIYPKSARDHEGRNVLSQVLRRDASYVDKFDRDNAGVAEMHHLELDFGSVARDNRAVLILNGWVDWADGSTFLAASQGGKGGLILPYLQVKDSVGQWKTVIEDMGLPAGKPKTIAVDLTGKFLSPSREVRIVTNLCVYWDEVFLSENTAQPEVVMIPLSPQSADLRFRGFSTPLIQSDRKQPERFDYEHWLSTSNWNPISGRYTRYGDVRPLLNSIDDRLVIMGSGDELRLLFSARHLPTLRRGWRRDFLFFVDGWAKDGDANTAYSESVEPLPFHAMSGYPYSSHEFLPDNEEYCTYRRHYNTRAALRLLPSLVGNAVH